MKKNILMVFVGLLLASCGTLRPLESPPVNIDPRSLGGTDSLQVLPPPIKKPLTPPPPSKIQMIDWKASLELMVQKILAADEIKDGSVLLINPMKNATNGNLQVQKATSILSNLIMADSRKKFQVIDTKTFNIARHTLGLYRNDRFESRSKALGLARYLNAQYLLYSSAIGNVRKPLLDLQIMLVKSGEIIWSGSGMTEIHD